MAPVDLTGESRLASTDVIPLVPIKIQSSVPKPTCYLTVADACQIWLHNRFTLVIVFSVAHHSRSSEGIRIK